MPLVLWASLKCRVEGLGDDTTSNLRCDMTREMLTNVFVHMLSAGGTFMNFWSKAFLQETRFRHWRWDKAEGILWGYLADHFSLFSLNCAVVLLLVRFGSQWKICLTE